VFTPGFVNSFIPPRQRHRFDDFIKENETAGHVEDNISLASQKNAVKMFVNHFCNIKKNQVTYFSSNPKLPFSLYTVADLLKKHINIQNNIIKL
jgi:hypothetical protein